MQLAPSTSLLRTSRHYKYDILSLLEHLRDNAKTYLSCVPRDTAGICLSSDLPQDVAVVSHLVFRSSFRDLTETTKRLVVL